MISIQMNKFPQTDKYKNRPAYIESSRIDKYTKGSIFVKKNVRIRTSPDTSSSKNIKLSTINPIQVEIVDRNVNGSLYEGSTIWYRIKYNNDSNLYVHSKLVDEVEKTYYKLNSNAFVKSEMNTNSHTYGTIKSGSMINIRKTSSSKWYEVVGYGTWRNANRKDVEYYVNPRNWIDTNMEKINTNMYQFLVLSGRAGVSTSQLNTELQGKGVLEGQGSAFVKASKRTNVNEAYLIAHSFLETGNGTSKLSKGILVNTVDGKRVKPKMVYNMYGIGALDRDAVRLGAEYAYKKGWFTIEDAIIGGAEWVANRYINHPTYKQDTLYKMRWNPDIPGGHSASI